MTLSTRPLLFLRGWDGQLSDLAGPTRRLELRMLCHSAVQDLGGHLRPWEDLIFQEVSGVVVFMLED